MIRSLASARVLPRAPALAVLLALVVPAAVRAGDADVQREPAGLPEDAVTLTLSGGVSLGAYEAGLAGSSTS